MKSFLPLLFLLLPALLFSQTRKVMIIGIDGVRPDALEFAATPYLDGLIANGLYSPDALNDDITFSGPGWSAILCGVWSEKHGVTNNNFSGSNYEAYPPIFKYLEDLDPEYNTLSICHWSPINDFIVQDFADFKLNVSADADVANQAAAYLTANDPDAVFLHFDDVDGAGHSSGFSPEVPAYIAAIEATDAYLGTVLDALENRPTYAEEDWLILVTTDHGGIGFGHGGNTIEEKDIFVIASGNSVPTALIEKDSTVTSDAPENCLNAVEELVFDGADDYVQVAPNALFDFGDAQDFTVECRVRTTTAADVAIVGNKDWDSGFNKGFVFSFVLPSGPGWKVNIGDGDNRADLNLGGAIADNAWHTLSVTFDRDGMMRMYEDGVFQAETDISGIGDITTEEGLYFGADIFSAYDYSGAIAEVRVWNTVLDPAAVEAWHCAPIENTHPDFANLIGYWKMNEGEGSTEVADFSGNNNPGIINGATWQTPDSIVTYNYENTPRLTDIVPTALTHLCVPFESDWDFDGASLIAECMTDNVNVQNADARKIDFHISPNPAHDTVLIEFENTDSELPLHLEIFDITGKKISAYQVTSAAFSLNISGFAAGEYLLSVRSKNEEVLTKKLVVR